eukprot:889241-Prymnesium_polylepis.1
MRMSAAPTLLLPGDERRHRARLPRHDELNLLGGPKGVPSLLMGVVFFQSNLGQRVATAMEYKLRLALLE